MDIGTLTRAFSLRTKLAAAVALVAIASASAGLALQKPEDTVVGVAQSGAATSLAVPVETVGGQAAVEGEQPGSSWPGEIISAGDVDVQPLREGTIVEWLVSIGQSVQRGQPMAKLSSAVATPELTGTLAEHTRELAEAKAELEAQTAYASARRKQLESLRGQVEKAASESGAGSVSASKVADAGRADITLQMEAVRDFTAETVRALFPLITAPDQEGRDPIRAYKDNPKGFSFPYRSGVGKTSEGAKTEFTRDLIEVMKAIVGNEDTIADKAKQFLRSADGLVASSADLDGVEEIPGALDPLDEIRELLAERRGEIFEHLGELSGSRIESATLTLEATSAATDVSEKLSEIDGELLEIERELAVARAAAQSAQAAFTTVNSVLGADASVVAPQSGTVSALHQKAGDFVEPGTPVASVNAGSERTVRFRIPGNATPPKAGDVLGVVRPGFTKDVRKVKVTGVGGSLDRNGSFLADAAFAEANDWPVHGSVRVLPPEGAAKTAPLVSLGAVWFDDQGRSNVWVVGPDDRISAKQVKTGRTLGDKVEVLEGGEPGARIVSAATPALKTGMKLPKVSDVSKRPKDQAPAGDGHDHEH